jgi:metal-dependent hydrolase (beta-lactamase superfamily II)
MKIPTTEEGKTVLQDAARVLLQGKTHYITGHCTGSAQYAVMEEVMKDRLQILFCGMEIEID